MSEMKTPGKFSWNEILTSDIAKAKGFYSELFGWSAIQTEMGPPGHKYVLFQKNGENVAGLASNQLGDWGDPSPRWASYVTVEDLKSSLARAKQLGGTLVSGPQEIPNIGQYAVIADPTGATLALYEAGENHG